MVTVHGISWAAMGPPTLTHRGSIAALLLLHLIVLLNTPLLHLIAKPPHSTHTALLLLAQIWLEECLPQ